MVKAFDLFVELRLKNWLCGKGVYTGLNPQQGVGFLKLMNMPPQSILAKVDAVANQVAADVAFRQEGAPLEVVAKILYVYFKMRHESVNIFHKTTKCGKYL